MNDTDQLIEQLAGRSTPVKPLASPLRRTALWLLLAAATVLAIVLIHGPRPDFWATMTAPSVALEWTASVLTAVLATYAMFQISVAGRSPSWAWLPLPAAMLWLGVLGVGCLRDVYAQGWQALAFESHVSECARMIVLTSLPIGLVMLWMVRHAGVVRPVPTAMLVTLGAAALSAAAVSLIHDGETALMALLWHAGVVGVLSLLGALSGNRVFAWIGYARR